MVNVLLVLLVLEHKIQVIHLYLHLVFVLLVVQDNTHHQVSAFHVHLDLSLVQGEPQAALLVLLQDLWVCQFVQPVQISMQLLVMPLEILLLGKSGLGESVQLLINVIYNLVFNFMLYQLEMLTVSQHNLLGILT